VILASFGGKISGAQTVLVTPLRPSPLRTGVANMAVSKLSVEERFWSKVDRSAGPEGCWLWTGSGDPKGYGTFWHDGRTRKAHRASWLLFKGGIPEGIWVLHRCDNPPCVNPAHLWLGTNADNVADMMRKGRDRHPLGVGPKRPARGAANGRAKLTEASVLAILADGRSHYRIAADYGVTHGVIWRIKRGERWRHLQEARS